MLKIHLPCKSSGSCLVPSTIARPDSSCSASSHLCTDPDLGHYLASEYEKETGSGKQVNTTATSSYNLVPVEVSLVRLLKRGRFPGLCSHVGEGGVKKLSKAVDSAVGNIGGILVDHLQPSLQAAAFKLNELHSLAKCTHQLQPLGLQVCRVANTSYLTIVNMLLHCCIYQ